MRGDTTLLVGGFGFSGVPNTLINALRDRSELKGFTVVSNNAGMPGVGLGECASNQPHQAEYAKKADSRTAQANCSKRARSRK